MSQQSEHDEVPEHNPSVAHERTEEDVKAISGFGIGLAIGIVVVVFAMWGMFEWFYAREDRASPAVAPIILSEKPQLPPEPRLQAVPRLDLKALHEGEDEILNNYAWIDPDKGIARIPIEEAIKIVAAKGLPSKPVTDLPDPQGYRLIPSVSSSGRTFEKISQ
jgi:hypothetical protein